MCVFYLKKRNGKPQIDWDKSTCLLKVFIRYAVAAELTSASPCSNVPVICTLCRPKRLAEWKYNLEAYLLPKHPPASKSPKLANECWDHRRREDGPEEHLGLEAKLSTAKEPEEKEEEESVGDL
jgi:hypothetical protein